MAANKNEKDFPEIEKDIRDDTPKRPTSKAPSNRHEADEAPEPEAIPAEATPIDPPKKKRGCFGCFFLAIAFLFVAALIGGLVVGLEAYSRLLPVSDVSKKIEVTIPEGASVPQIGKILEQAGIIRSAEAFRYLVSYKKVGPKLKAGEQVLDAGQNTAEVINTLIRGNFKTYPITIPEGLTMAQIADLMQDKGLATRSEFLKLCNDQAFIQSLGLDVPNLEGYLFPETYNFTRGTTPRDIVKEMVKMFLRVWSRYETAAEGNKLNRHQIVTMASIVEKETGAPEERPMIAAVFLNRLDKGMRLETDPTVIYGIKDFDGNLTKKHLQTPTPYNTYVIEGLPPGPIANPGEDSIRAVLSPARVDYLYFVSKNDGTHQFSKTLKEHNNAVNKYQRRRSN
jgi:UPF0755 protein